MRDELTTGSHAVIGGPLTRNPSNGDFLQRYLWHSEEERDALLDAALEAHAGWRETPLSVRARLLTELGRRLEAGREEDARLMAREMGKPLAQARAEIDKCAWACRHFAEHGAAALAPLAIATDADKSGVRFDPLGVVLGVMPWNYPYWQVIRFAVPALLAGNTVVLKHAPSTTGCALRLEERFAEAGFPAGAFAHLRADEPAVAETIRDARVAAVTLTGSVAAGRAVAAVAGEALKPCVLELGGSDVFVVLDDADLEAAADAAVLARFQNTGQSCIAAKRFLVHASVHDAFVDALATRVRALRVGDPMDEATEVGPMAREDLTLVLDEQARASVDAGAREVVSGGADRTRPGAWFAPTLLVDVAPGMPAFDEETFGPLAAVTRVESLDEALVLANMSRFGLGASFWTADVASAEAAMGQVDVGHVSINGIVKSDPRMPFGGIKDSGYGRELGPHGVRAFTNPKSYWVKG